MVLGPLMRTRAPNTEALLPNLLAIRAPKFNGACEACVVSIDALELRASDVLVYPAAAD